MHTPHELELLWETFARDEQLSVQQVEQFQKYCALLLDWNTRMNLTAIVDPLEVIQCHFQDALKIASCVNMLAVKVCADVGSGAGFPGIPLKIAFPALTVILIETNAKKISFLEHVIAELGLEDIHIYHDDWRSFIRTGQLTVDLFCARASLAPTELLRVIRSGSIHRNALLVYFASRHWVPTEKEKEFVISYYPYQVGVRQRQLVLFGRDRAHSLLGITR